MVLTYYSCAFFSIFQFVALEECRRDSSNIDNGKTEEQRNRTLSLIRSSGELLWRGPKVFGYIDPSETEEPQDEDEETEEQQERNREDLYYLLTKFVSKIDGVMAIKNYCEDHKGKTYLDLLTYSDVAYFCAVMRNLEETWDYEYRMTLASGEERRKYNDPQEIEDDGERAQYIEPKPRFTGGVKKKRELFKMMWSEEGTQYYKKAEGVWKEALADESVREWLQEGWHDWVRENSIGGHWRKKRKSKPTRDNDVERENTLDYEDIPEMRGSLENCNGEEKSDEVEGEDGGGGKGTMNESNEDSSSGSSEESEDSDDDDDEATKRREGRKRHEEEEEEEDEDTPKRRKGRKRHEEEDGEEEDEDTPMKRGRKKRRGNESEDETESQGRSKKGGNKSRTDDRNSRRRRGGSGRGGRNEEVPVRQVSTRKRKPTKKGDE